MNKAGIYIHIPFCQRRCIYCDFYFTTNLKLLDGYIESLTKEITLASPNYNNVEFDTIFFGGGTPSLLSTKQIESILNTVYKEYNISSKSEISIECNPEDLDNYNLKELKQVGINRLSIGIQSFVDSELKFLTREHSAKQAENVILKANDNFKNISVDFIYSLPKQTKDEVEYSLDKLIEFNIPHISAYTLIFEEKTLLYKQFMKKIVTPNRDEHESELYEFVSNKLITEGYQHYEISNFAKEGYESKHNLKYWEYDNYLGFGPSSHSYFENKRWENFRSIQKYKESLENNQLPIAKKEILNKNEMRIEYIMLALRSKGINLKKYKKIFEEDFHAKYEKAIKELMLNDYAVMNAGEFKLNEKGYAIADEIIAKYF
ncbi:MAG: radical SAM family heme chaperone HemW [Ignavibacteria bacterium]|nr:radical SAM family heme chaperone HemW [Ignavibacteria bacterium]